MFDIPYVPAGYQPYVIGGVLLVAGLKILGMILGKPKEDNDLYVMKRCACGWVGRVSKLSPVCRKCGMDIPLG